MDGTRGLTCFLPPCPDAFQRALAQNQAWAARTDAKQPEFFAQLAKGQRPEILWIGCADARCPANTLLDSPPGSVFVHRNIANLVSLNDISLASVLEFGINALNIKHIVLCGHSHCGGVAGALSDQKLGLLDVWLAPLRQLRDENQSLLNTLSAEEQSLKLTELNIRRGVETLTHNSTVREAIKNRGLDIHGVMYNLGTGVLRDLQVDFRKSMAATAPVSEAKPIDKS